MDQDCVFCKIISKEIPGDIVYEDDEVLAFRDINPAAPTHVLVIPKIHKRDILDFSEEDKPLLGSLMLAVKKITKKLGIAETGFRTVINTGADGGQTVFHLHLHIMAGKKLDWLPG